MYLFTRKQLIKLLRETIEMQKEYVDKHGKEEDAAIASAIFETVDGLDAEMELFDLGQCELSMQCEIEERFDY